MKKIIFPFLTLAALLFAACKTEEYKAKDETLSDYLELQHPCITYNDIVRIAHKYGVEDSIAPGYRSKMFQLPDPMLYPYISVGMIDSFFAQGVKFYEHQQEYAIFNREKFNLTSVAGYYELIESLPGMYHSQMWGMSLDEYEKMKATKIATYDIYMSFDSTITFFEKGEPFEYGRKLNKD